VRDNVSLVDETSSKYRYPKGRMSICTKLP
jgi:hypothetical protein